MAARLTAAAASLLSMPRAAAADGAPDFAAWQRLHGKRYASADEELRRAAIFAANVRRYAKRDAEEPLATFGPDKWSDRTPAEARGARRRLRGYGPAGAAEPAPPGVDWAAASVDWRHPADNPKGVNAVTAVQDQGSSGCCWAFGVTGCLEGMTVVQQGLPLEKLSEQELIDCCDACQYAAPSWSYDYLINNTHGVDSTEASYPYKGDQPRTTCALKSGKTQSGSKILAGRGSVGKYTQVTGDDAILAKLADIGPANIGIDSSCIDGYTKGVITNCKGDGVDHAVLIVGAGVDGVPYWTVKNSWASDFGEGGFFRFKRNAGQLSMGSAHWPITNSTPITPSPPTPAPVPVSCHVGDEVMAFWPSGGGCCPPNSFYPAAIVSFNGDKVTVRYDDDGSTKMLRDSEVLVNGRPCAAHPPPPSVSCHLGDKVMVLWDVDGSFYPAVIVRFGAGNISVRYDDDGEVIVERDADVLLNGHPCAAHTPSPPVACRAGDKVMAVWTDGMFYAAVIVSLDGSDITVRFDDDGETLVVRDSDVKLLNGQPCA